MQGTKVLQYLPKSTLLGSPGMAQQFLATATSLVSSALTSHRSASPSVSTFAALTGVLSSSSSSDSGFPRLQSSFNWVAGRQTRC